MLSVLHGGSVNDVEVVHEVPGLGRRTLVLDARRVVRDDDGAHMILVAFEDITERREARDELRRLNGELEDRVGERTAQLEASNRELEAFCYSVSHDLRAPLRALDGFSEELLRRYPGKVLDEKGEHYLRRLRSGTQRMGQLIDDLLKLSRLSRAELSHALVDLTALAASIAEELQEHEPARQVTFAIMPGLSAVGDGALLRVALENLLNNAWKFTAKKAQATILFGRAERDGRPAFVVGGRRGGLRHGPRRQALRRVPAAPPRARVPRQRRRPRHGPAHRPPARRADLGRRQPGARGDLHLHGARKGAAMREKIILLVEDNQDDEELATLAFERNRIANAMIVVRDGQEALDYLLGTEAEGGRDAKPLPQLVLLDLKLPKVDGLEVLRRLRANPRTRLLPVVVLTSSREEEDLLSSYALGANSYVRKPVEFSRFAEAIHELQMYWLVLNEAPTREG
jgi:CheY-like chemotaxis protein/signal transduction histidine kinase